MSTREKSSTATVLFFVICYLKGRKQQNEHRNIQHQQHQNVQERKSLLPHVAGSRHHSHSRRLARRAAPVELHPRRRHGPLLRRHPERPPPSLHRSPSRPLRRRHL